jgi:hypothetical protein
MSRKTPWAILLCKFKDDRRGFVTINKQDLVTLFTAQDVENVVTFWQDVSYGELDLSGSEVFGWLTLDKNQQDYKGSGENPAGRRDLVNWAKKAASDQGIKLDRHFGIIVYMSTGTDLWGSTGVVVCDNNSNLAQILQEVGHGYGLKHSRAVANPNDYENPFCIMSGLTFGGTDPTFNGRFASSGPGLCAPYVYQSGWLSDSRVVRVTTNGQWPSSNKILLSPLGKRNPPYPQVAIFEFNDPQKMKYFVEYRSGGWDRGLSQNAIVIHQLRPDGYAYYSGHIATSEGVDESGAVLPAGNVYLDSRFDLSIQVLSILDNGRVAHIRIAPAAAVGTLSVRTVARSKLGITGGLSVGGQIIRPSTTSLRDSLVELLGR